MLENTEATDCGTWVKGTLNLAEKLNSSYHNMRSALCATLQAADGGSIGKTLPHNDLESEARAVRQNPSNVPMTRLGPIKQTNQAATSNNLDAQLVFKVKLQKNCGETADDAKGVSALLQKRAPHLAGR